MALVIQGYKFVVTLAESSGKTTDKTYDLRATVAADAATAGGTIVTALNAVTDMVVQQTSLNLVSVEDALVLPANVEKENQAIVSFAIADAPNKGGTFSIPGASIGIFSGTLGDARDIVDILDTDLITYANLFAAAGVAYISDGEDLDFMRGGRRRHMKNTRS